LPVALTCLSLPGVVAELGLVLGLTPSSFLASCWSAYIRLSSRSRTSTDTVVLNRYTWMTNDLRPGQTLKGKLAWANGDTTGYGIHGDFINGYVAFRIAEGYESYTELCISVLVGTGVFCRKL
jgi:hypothetical protein